MKIPPKSNYQVLKELVNTHSKGPSAVFGVSWRSYKLRTWHYSGQLKKKRRNRSFVISSESTDKNARWFTSNYNNDKNRLGKKKSLAYAPSFRSRILSMWGKTKQNKTSFCSLTIRKAKFYEVLQWHGLQGIHIVLVPKGEKDSIFFFSRLQSWLYFSESLVFMIKENKGTLSKQLLDST